MLTAPATAHPVYMDHVEHHVHIAVNRVNIDITIELRFNEFRSLTERRRMDTDRDGLIDAAERDRYLRRIRREVADTFSLFVEGRPLELVELYEPRLDLLGTEGVSPDHHALKLYYFARMPAELREPVELTFEDRSWPSAPALWLPGAVGNDDLSVRVAAGPSSRPAETTSDTHDESTRPQRVTLIVAPRPSPATQPAQPSGR